MHTIIKRDSTRQLFDSQKIVHAVEAAFNAVDGEVTKTAHATAQSIADRIEALDATFTVEQVQDMVENALMDTERKDVARAYIRYRYKREVIRKENTTDASVMQLLCGTNDYWNTENANKNAKTVSTQRDYLAGITSTDITRRFLLEKDIVEAHDAGIIHFHDADYFAQNVLHNCELCNIGDMLQNGTVINGVRIDKPHRLLTATTIATQIILAVSSSSYGGCTVTLTHLAPFVRDSYKIHLKKYIDNGLDEATAKKLADIDIKKEVNDSVQTFNYQVNSMTSTNGQAPFLSVCMYLGETDDFKAELAMLIEAFFHQRMLGFKNEKGVYITPAFPKLLYVLEPDNITPDSPYYYLTKLAAQCTAKRMVPDYISAKMMQELKINAYGTGDVYPCMGCRSFLTPWRTKGNPSNDLTFKEGKGKYYGRFNQGVVTLNLPDVALSSGRDMAKFWQILDDRLELCHRALQARTKRLAAGTSDVAPVLWQHGALARLEKGESLAKLLYDGYSTISLGYAGLYECVKYMTGESHTHSSGHDFGMAVMKHLNDACLKWKTAENIDYSVYGTPIESTTYKFATCLKKRFGPSVFVELDGKDRDYITNSYHVPVFEPINPFEKLALESDFQKLSPGGAISYIECADLTHNIDAVLQVIEFIYGHIMYAELNTKSDYCQACGYDGEIEIVDKDNKLDWRCPNCGNMDHATMNVARRTCGYIGTNYFNQGRTDEIRNRYVHLDDKLLDDHTDHPCPSAKPLPDTSSTSPTPEEIMHS